MWSLNYCFTVFIAIVGILQLAAANSNLRSLLFFPRRIYTVIFAIVTIGFALFTFFTWNELETIVVEGSQQAGSFVLSAAVAIIFTLVFSSLLNHRRKNNGASEQEDGLEALRESTFFQALRNHKNGK